MRALTVSLTAAIAILVLSACGKGGEDELIPCGPNAPCPQGYECSGKGFCVININADQVTLTVQLAGMGTVDVTGQQSCTSGSCPYSVSKGGTVSLTARPASGWSFTAWSGSCSGTAAATTVKTDAAATCTATFTQADQASYPVTVAAEAGGAVSGAGLTCTAGTCTGRIATGTQLHLTATADSGHRFVNWTGSGGCSGTAAQIDVDVAAEIMCTAHFVQTFTVSVTADGGAAPVAVAAGSCSGASCSADKNSDATFTAGDLAGSRFSGWSGDAACSGRSNPLVVKVIAPLACVAHYVRRVTIAGLIGGGLDGDVTATSPDVNSTCSGMMCVADKGSQVTLVAPSVPGQRLTSWSGAGCSAGTIAGNGITLTAGDADLTCTATYAPGVAVSGTVVGAVGVVTATAKGTNVSCSPGLCGLDSGGEVTLTAPDLAPGFRFEGWSGDAGCAGTSAALTFSNVQTSISCQASYVRRLKGGGSVEPGLQGLIIASAGPGSVCVGAVCTVDEGEMITLTAPEIPGERFVGWLGDGCDGDDPVLVITPSGDDVACIADYAKGITVQGKVTGELGNVTASSDSPGHVCRADGCVIDVGGNVTLSAPDLEPEHRFTGWTGDAGCAGATRMITLQEVAADTQCFANYKKRVTVTAGVAVDTEETVKITTDGGNPACEGTSCIVDEGTSVTLDAPAPAGYRFTGWKGDAVCQGKTDDPLTFAAAAKATCTAAYVRQFTVGVAASPAVGEVSVAAGACTSSTSCLVDEDATATFTADDTVAGYRFAGWDGAAACKSANATIQVVVTGALSCSATYVQRFTVAGAVAEPGKGAVTASGDAFADCAAGSSCVADKDSSVKLVAPLTPGFRVKGWTGAGCEGGVVAGSGITIKATANLTCTAQYELGISVSGTVVGAKGVVKATSGSVGSSCDDLGTCTLSMPGDVTLEAPDLLPDARFVTWGGTGCPTSTQRTIVLTNVSTSLSCTATYILRYTVSGKNAAGVTVSADSDENPKDCKSDATGGACTVDSGHTVTLTATIPGGRNFTGWDGTGCGAVNPAKVTPTSGAVTCTVKSAAIVTVKAVATGGASPVLKAESVSPGAKCEGASCTLNEGGDVSLSTTNLAPDYRFLGWNGDPGCAGTATDFLIKVEDVTALSTTCSANFIDRHRVEGKIADGVVHAVDEVVKVTATDDPNGDCPTASVCTVDDKKKVRLVAPVLKDYRFDGWTPGTCGAGADITITPTGDTTCTAKYVKQITITVAAGTGGKASACLSASACTGTSITADEGTMVWLNATKDASYHFTTWSGTGCTPATSATLNFAIKATTCTASFAKDTFTATAAVDPAGAGTATVTYKTCTATSCAVDSGDSAHFKAVAGGGFKFAAWSANCGGGTTAEIDVAITAATTCTASFLIPITGTADPVGTITGTPPASCGQPGGSVVCTVAKDTTVGFTAKAESGYVFTGWSGGCVQDPGDPLKVTIKAATAATCTARFRATWARSYGVAGNRDDAFDMIASEKGVTIFGDSAKGSEGRTPLLLGLEPDDGDPTAATLIQDKDGKVPLGDARAIGALASGSMILVATADGTPMLGRVNDALVVGKILVLPVKQPFTQEAVALAVGADGEAHVSADLFNDKGQGTVRVVTTKSDSLAVNVSLCASSDKDCKVCVEDNHAGPVAEMAGGTAVALVPAQGSSLVVAFLDEGGSVKWARTVFFEGNTPTPHGMVATQNGVLVVGEVQKGRTEDRNAFYAFLDRDKGDLVFGKTLGRSGKDDYLTHASVDAKGNFLIAGTTTDAMTGSRSDLWLVRVSKDGTKVDQGAYGGPGTDVGAAAVPTKNEEIILAGRTASFLDDAGDVWAMRLLADLSIGFNEKSGAFFVRPSTTGAGSLGVVEAQACVVRAGVEGSVSSTDAKTSPTDLVLGRQAP